VLSEAYALFTHQEKEDRVFLEGLALWAGHDFSSPKGTDVAHWAEEYRKQVVKKGWYVPSYNKWGNNIRVVLKGERAMKELAEIVVYSIKCMGKGRALFVPPQIDQKIAQAGGARKLGGVFEGKEPPEPRHFTPFLAKAIEERKSVAQPEGGG